MRNLQHLHRALSWSPLAFFILLLLLFFIFLFLFAGFKRVIRNVVYSNHTLQSNELFYNACTFNIYHHNYIPPCTLSINNNNNNNKVILVGTFISGYLRCFDTVSRRPYRCFSVALKVILSLSDRQKIFTSD